MMCIGRIVSGCTSISGESARLKSLRISDVRNLRQAADTLVDTADQHRAILIDQLGLKRYIFNALGQAAHCLADDSQLVWPEGKESIDGDGAKLGDYLFARTQAEQRLPQAVLVGGKKYYL
jgi:hypothetical protein